MGVVVWEIGVDGMGLISTPVYGIATWPGLVWRVFYS